MEVSRGGQIVERLGSIRMESLKRVGIEWNRVRLKERYFAGCVGLAVRLQD